MPYNFVPDSFHTGVTAKALREKIYTPKMHILARNSVIWRIDRKNRCSGLGYRLSEEPKKCAFSHIWGANGGNRIVMTFCIG